MADDDVLIVGAGPTALTMALFLARQGIRPRIIDRNDGPGLASRAMVVQARTLEFYQQLGFAQQVIDAGIKVHRIHLRKGNEERAVFDISDIGQGISPFPYALSYPQDDHEKLLGQMLEAEGIHIEWGIEMLDLEDRGTHVHATIRDNGAMREFDTAYVCGCDGAHSVVRRCLDLQFLGGTYDSMFFVADVDATGDAANGDINMCLGAHELCLVFPIRSSGMFRLIGLIPDEIAAQPVIEFDAIRPIVENLVGIDVTKVNWFSSYRVHHRVAEQFRVGRAFIAGDAGHVHSPVGGQGMNTGIGDAVNLAWKLAAVIQGRADSSLLDTYEPERIAFAHSLVATTDRVFTVITGESLASQAVRSVLFPSLAPFALGFTPLRKAAFRLVSQTRISYHNSALSQGAAGDIDGGDRLPWVSADGIRDNFEPLQTVDWQIHVYGNASANLRETAARHGLPLLEFPWCTEADNAGLERDAYYLIRPDSYVAMAIPDQDTDALYAFVERWKIKMRA